MRRLACLLLTAALAVLTTLAVANGPAGAGTAKPTATATAAAPPTCGGYATVPKLGGAGLWYCSFDDEFSGSSLDPTKWTPVTSTMSGLIAGPVGCFVDSPNNISVGNGVLSLTARKEAKPFTCTNRYGWYGTEYTAGQVASSGLFSQTYGRFAIRAKFPASTVAGLQSALWMWPQNLPSTGLQGEIDIAEEYSVSADRVVPYLHYNYDADSVNVATKTNIPTNYYCMINNVNAFHEYTLDWTPRTISIFYDGKMCLQNNLDPQGPSPFNQPFFLALTQSLGIKNNLFNPATTQLPATTQVDYVRVWK
ncbi:MAG: hypothetical protein QOC66_1280 [Pseudonocardiales bacterium]|nr:hypothetical protein [Pseudonocardiales bacterium]